MSLSPGVRVAGYEIVAKLGEGGMGEVWRARDPQLGRDVALKVLPEAFTSDPERLARFEREAKLLAQLNHPNIAHIYGFERSGDVRALVMELVEGPTLAERLKAGAIPVTEALSLARQIAEALEEAHEKGIVHRDLKPQNIKASVDGKIKVLDFGLARAFEATPVSELSSLHLAHSPTLTLGGTIEGVILGTAAYMAPEQAKGLVVDKRADIWAFGVVLFEMLTGKPLFASDSVPDTLARVLQREVDFEALPDSTQPPLRRLLRRCLERQPKNRLHDIADARLVIDDLLAGRSEATPAAERRTGTARLLLASWAISVLAISALLFTVFGRPERPPPLRGQFEISLPLGRQLDAAFRRAIAISPDGRTLAVITTDAEQPPADGKSKDRRIELRGLDDSAFRPVVGTEGALELAFSPDGKWLAFSVLSEGPGWIGEPYSEIRKVPVGGGSPVTLCKNRGGWGLSWSESGRISFGGPDGAIQSVREGGGEVEPLLQIDDRAGAKQQLNPLALPGGRAWLFNDATPSAPTDLRYRLHLVSDAESAPALLFAGGADPRFLPPDRLLFVRDGVIQQVRFDLDERRVRGKPETIVDGVAQSVATPSSMSESGQAQYDVSLDGTLVYGPGGIAPPPAGELVWVRPGQTEVPLDLAQDPYLLSRISPDGSKLILSMVYRNRQVELYDLERGMRRRLMSRGTSTWGIWGPGRDQVTFSSDHEGAWRFYVADINGPVDSATALFDRSFEQSDDGPSSWSPDGKHLLFVVQGATSNPDIWLYEVGGTPKPYLATRFGEGFPEFSPDGRWVAYASNESGTLEVWVRPFGIEGPAVQVSVGGGAAPVWSRDGASISYLWRAQDEAHPSALAFYRVPVAAGSGRFEFGKPERLFAGEFRSAEPIRGYDVAADGRLLLNRPHSFDAAEKARRAEILFPKKLIVLLGHLGNNAR